jgi:hypothetical protein
VIVLGAVLIAALGKAGEAVEGTRFGGVLRGLTDDFQTVAGERPAMNLLDRLVVGAILSGPKSCRL